jgi:hypothetical protein
MKTSELLLLFIGKGALHSCYCTKWHLKVDNGISDKKVPVPGLNEKKKKEA